MPYTSRGTDVPVVLDKMIHDIDILLSLVKSEVASLEATGMSIITNSLDMAHARILFKSGLPQVLCQVGLLKMMLGK